MIEITVTVRIDPDKITPDVDLRDIVYLTRNRMLEVGESTNVYCHSFRKNPDDTSYDITTLGSSIDWSAK